MKNYRPEIISARSCSACKHFALDFTLDGKGGKSGQTPSAAARIPNT